MTSLSEFFTGDPTPKARLREIRVTAEPAMIIAFTDEPEEAHLHWVHDPGWKCFVVCPGPRCPICHFGKRPEVFFLLPVIDAPARVIAVLRISAKRVPGSLGLALLPILKDPAVTESVLLVSRDESFVHHVEARPLQDDASWADELVESFQRDQQNGLKLATAFMSPTAAQLGEVPSIRQKIGLVGGPPEADAP